ncbi:MAG: hypothetical protein OIN86_13035 [Candidatus Methanoperedens sp.]|nr:hypothetical protein [Candidatus Methanoperedens sp.]CAG0948858.1 hypothetical protein METP1_00062 [Methanosarcinales archaeon]
MNKSDEKSKYTMYIIILAILSVYFILISVPADSTKKDVYVTVKVYQSLTTKVEITNIEVMEKPATIIATPTYLADLIQSGSLKVVASTPSVSAIVTSNPILIYTSTDMNLVLKNVPVDENTVTIKLYDNNNLVTTKEVTLV